MISDEGEYWWLDEDPPASKTDHEGTTAFGLYYLGESYHRAAAIVASDHRGITDGPAKLLALHACELFLKAYLVHIGHQLDGLKAYMHNFGKLHELAVSGGLETSAATTGGLTLAAELAEHNRARYVVVRRSGGLSAQDGLRLADDLHRRVAGVLGMQVLL